MARTIRDSNLESRSARERLKPRGKPYYRLIDTGLHLGYRKGKRGGQWVARIYVGEQKYKVEAIGPADDTLDADGVAVLTFAQAQAVAREKYTQFNRVAAGHEAVQAGPYRVRDAMADYVTWFRVHKRGLNQVTTNRDAYILPALGDIEVAKLTTAKLRAWHEGIAASARRVRQPAAPRADSPSPAQPAAELTKPDAEAVREALRRRRATANRVLTILKAALNYAWSETKKAASDDAWRRVKPFRDVDNPVVRYLTEGEIKRLVNASSAEFRPMVRAALLTGCRYGELTRLRAADFNADSGTVLVRASKGGKPRHVTLGDEGQQFFASAVLGKAPDALIFTKKDGAPWGKSHQARPIKAASKAANINPVVSFHILRHTHGSTLAMKAVPMGVIAKQLGHADERMTQRHYAHLAPNYVADTIRANFPRLGIVDQNNVTLITGKKRKAKTEARA